MKVAILTSSRADYGIYLPLLKALKADIFFELHIIAFGTHLSQSHGETIQQIIQDGFEVSITVETMPDGDTPEDISKAMGKTIRNFSDVWSKHSFDLVIALADRYEMFAACVSLVPYGIPLAHIHGGETTLGAIDDAFRHSITHMAKFHFTTTERYKDRVIQLKGSEENVCNVGALSIDNLRSLSLYTIEEFKLQFNIDLTIPSILITFHPETVAFEKNSEYIRELVGALKVLADYQLIINMPNADTMGTMIREELKAFIKGAKHAIAVESFGVLGYLSCMKHCSMMLGNSSSGFVEASFFPKYVINLGDRQKGRIVTDNILNCEIKKNEILAAVDNFRVIKLNHSCNIYGDGNAAREIVKTLKASYQVNERHA